MDKPKKRRTLSVRKKKGKNASMQKAGAEVPSPAAKGSVDGELMMPEPVLVKRGISPGDFGFQVETGAESDTLPVLWMQAGTSASTNGLQSQDVLLSINGRVVAGYTCGEINQMLKTTLKDDVEIQLDILPQPKRVALKYYLNNKIKGYSYVMRKIQQDVQTSLYKTTIACTTRLRRKGEMDGVHYNFLDTSEFKNMVKLGHFLEWGEHNGHFYGTLKHEVAAMVSPATTSTVLPQNTTVDEVSFIHSTTDSTPPDSAVVAAADSYRDVIRCDIPCTTRPIREGEIKGSTYNYLHRDLFQSLVQAGQFEEWGDHNDEYYGLMKKGFTFPSRRISREDLGRVSPHFGSSNSSIPRYRDLCNWVEKDDSKMGPLPKYWHKLVTKDGRQYFLNTKNFKKQWIDPRMQSTKSVGKMPNGWDAVEHPTHGTFYVDHINQTTTFTPPWDEPNGGVPLSESLSTVYGKPTTRPANGVANVAKVKVSGAVKKLPPPAPRRRQSIKKALTASKGKSVPQNSPPFQQRPATTSLSMDPYSLISQEVDTPSIAKKIAKETEIVECTLTKPLIGTGSMGFAIALQGETKRMQIVSVAADSCADGILQVNDELLAVNGNKISSLIEIQQILKHTRKGTHIVLMVLRISSVIQHTQQKETTDIHDEGIEDNMVTINDIHPELERAAEKQMAQVEALSAKRIARAEQTAEITLKTNSPSSGFFASNSPTSAARQLESRMSALSLQQGEADAEVWFVQQEEVMHRNQAFQLRKIEKNIEEKGFLRALAEETSILADASDTLHDIQRDREIVANEYLTGRGFDKPVTWPSTLGQDVECRVDIFRDPETRSLGIAVIGGGIRSDPVIISEVSYKSNAAAVGVRAGDTVLAVGGKDVVDLLHDEVVELLKDRTIDPILLVLQRTAKAGPVFYPPPVYLPKKMFPRNDITSVIEEIEVVRLYSQLEQQLVADLKKAIARENDIQDSGVKDLWLPMKSQSGAQTISLIMAKLDAPNMTA